MHGFGHSLHFGSNRMQILWTYHYFGFVAGLQHIPMEAGSARCTQPQLYTRAALTHIGHDRVKHVRLAQEIRHKYRTRPEIQIRWGAQLLDATGIHQTDAVGHSHRLFLVMRDIDDGRAGFAVRSEEHTSELQSLMRISYA